MDENKSSRPSSYRSSSNIFLTKSEAKLREIAIENHHKDDKAIEEPCNLIPQIENDDHDDKPAVNENVDADKTISDHNAEDNLDKTVVDENDDHNDDDDGHVSPDIISNKNEDEPLDSNRSYTSSVLSNYLKDVIHDAHTSITLESKLKHVPHPPSSTPSSRSSSVISSYLKDVLSSAAKDIQQENKKPAKTLQFSMINDSQVTNSSTNSSELQDFVGDVLAKVSRDIHKENIEEEADSSANSTIKDDDQNKNDKDDEFDDPVFDAELDAYIEDIIKKVASEMNSIFPNDNEKSMELEFNKDDLVNERPKTSSSLKGKRTPLKLPDDHDKTIKSERPCSKASSKELKSYDSVKKEPSLSASKVERPESGKQIEPLETSKKSHSERPESKISQIERPESRTSQKSATAQVKRPESKASSKHSQFIKDKPESKATSRRSSVSHVERPDSKASNQDMKKVDDKNESEKENLNTTVKSQNERPLSSTSNRSIKLPELKNENDLNASIKSMNERPRSKMSNRDLGTPDKDNILRISTISVNERPESRHTNKDVGIQNDIGISATESHLNTNRTSSQLSKDSRSVKNKKLQVDLLPIREKSRQRHRKLNDSYQLFDESFLLEKDAAVQTTRQETTYYESTRIFSSTKREESKPTKTSLQNSIGIQVDDPEPEADEKRLLKRDKSRKRNLDYRRIFYYYHEELRKLQNHVPRVEKSLENHLQRMKTANKNILKEELFDNHNVVVAPVYALDSDYQSGSSFTNTPDNDIGGYCTSSAKLAKIAYDVRKDEVRMRNRLLYGPTTKSATCSQTFETKYLTPKRQFLPLGTILKVPTLHLGHQKEGLSLERERDLITRLHDNYINALRKKEVENS